MFMLKPDNFLVKSLLLKTLAVITTLILAISVTPFTQAGNIKTPTAIDLGNVEVESLNSFKFTLRNNGTKRIEIGPLEASCSCTDVSLEGDSQMAPSEERTVSGNVHAGRISGAFSLKVSGFGLDNAGEAEKFYVPVTGNVVTDLIPDKTVIYFGDVDQAVDPLSTTIKVLRGNSGRSWNDIEAVYDHRNLSVSISKVSENEFSVSLTLHTANLPFGPMLHSIKLYPVNAANRLAHSFDMQVRANLVGPIKVVPSSIYLGSLTQATKLERTIKISSSRLDTKHLRFASQTQFAKVDSMVTGQDFIQFHFTIIAPMAAGPFSKKLSFADEQGQTRVEVPVLGSVSMDAPAGSPAVLSSTSD